MSDLQERLATIERPLVFFHAPCPDGSCAAWLASKRFPRADLVGVQYGPPVEVDGNSITVKVEGGGRAAFGLKGVDVFMLDWTPPRPTETLAAVARVAQSLFVFDHHESALRELDGPKKVWYEAEQISRGNFPDTPPRYPYLILDKTRSGAGIALDVFFPGFRDLWKEEVRQSQKLDGRFLPTHEKTDGHMTAIALLIEDRDLWRFDLPGAREVAAYLDCAGASNGPAKFDALPDIADMRAEGAAMLRYQAALVDRIAGKATVCQWAEGGLLVVNSPVLQSEVGEALYRRAPAPLKAAAVWHEDAEKTVVSLRSLLGGLDCAAAAKARGGGGHERSASFAVPHRGPWRWSARLDRNVHQDEVGAS